MSGILGQDTKSAKEKVVATPVASHAHTESDITDLEHINDERYYTEDELDPPKC